MTAMATHEELHAYVLARASQGAAGRVADAARRLKGVSRSECVMHGQYDVVVVLDVPSIDLLEINRLVAGIEQLPDVERTELCVSAVHHDAPVLVAQFGG